MRKRGAFVCSNCEEAFPEAPASAGKRGRVFLSYGHDPACEEIVWRVEADLRARGWDPWLDKAQIRTGDVWRSEITRGLQQSQHVLAFLSEHSTRKPGVCRKEVAIALGPGKCHVYTVLVEPLAKCRPPLIITHRQWLDMQHWRELKASDPAGYEALYQRSLAEIVRVLERNEPFAGEIAELQHWLNPVDGTADMIAAENEFTGREWLLGGIAEQAALPGGEVEAEAPGEIELWRTGGSLNRMLLLTAEPGWGKSAVAARLAHAGRARVMAVHFCKYNRPDTRDARGVLRTLAYQMATQLEEYRSLLVQRARHGVALDQMNAAELFHELFASQLANVIEGGRGAHDRHLIVLDALDETLDGFGRSELVNLVAGEFDKLPDWLGLVVTSRPEAPVLRQLTQFGVTTLKAGEERNTRDVEQYVRQWLASLPLAPSALEPALRSVMFASAGNFLYVRQLQEAVREGAVQAAQLHAAAALPRGLASLYERWFQYRFPDPARYDEQQRPLLEIMLAAREPLPQDLAAAVLAWGPYGKKVIESLGSLCVRSELGALSLFHKSLRDWLADPEKSGWVFHVSEENGHCKLAEGMLKEFRIWEAAGSLSDPEAGWGNLGEYGEAYALRHLPSHQHAIGRHQVRAEILTSFSFAMRRCARGMLEELLDDYRLFSHDKMSFALQAWHDCIIRSAHLIRRSTENWPAQKIFLQVALEHALTSPITIAAERFLSSSFDRAGAKILRLRDRPLNYRTNDRGHVATIEIGHLRSDEKYEIVMINPQNAIIFGNGHLLQLDLVRGHVQEQPGAELKVVLLLDEGFYLTWNDFGVLSLKSFHSFEPIAELNLFPAQAFSSQENRLTIPLQIPDLDFSCIEKIDDARFFVCVGSRIVVYNYKSKNVDTDLLLNSSVHGVAFNGEETLFCWQGLEKDPFLLNLSSKKCSSVTSDFESANLDGALFLSSNIVLFWARGDLCFYDMKLQSAKYLEFEEDGSEECSADEPWLRVKKHPTKPEVFISSMSKIKHYSSTGKLIDEVSPPKGFQDFAICIDDSVVVWGGLDNGDFVWFSSRKTTPIFCKKKELTGSRLQDWIPSADQLLLVGPDGALRAVPCPTDVNVTHGAIEPIDNGRVICFDPTVGDFTIWDVALLEDSSTDQDLSERIASPWITEQGRIAYFNEEDDLCIFSRDQATTEFVLFGCPSNATDLVITDDQISVRSADGSVYLYNRAGELVRRFRVGNVRGASPGLPGKVVVWDNWKIGIWEQGTSKPKYLTGIENYFEDEPLSRVAVSSCGKVVAACCSDSYVYLWIGNSEAPLKIANVKTRVDRLVVSAFDSDLLVVVQTRGGTVTVMDALNERCLGNRDFADDVVTGVVKEANEFIVTFRSGATWSPRPNKITYPVTPRIDIHKRHIQLSAQNTYVEWHCNSDINWAVPLGCNELLVVAARNTRVLSFLDLGN